MRDFFDKVPAVVILFVLVSVVRGIMRLFKGKPSDAPPAMEGGESDEARRVREIQERIRRIAAERRGQAQPSTPRPPLTPPVVTERRMDPPPLSTPTAPLGESPLQRKLREIERRMQKTERAPTLHRGEAEVQRRQQLEEKEEDLAEKKFLALRHAQQLVAAQQAVAQSEIGLRTTARARLLEDLQDPQSLRRAFVLREVLGTPVGLR